MPSSPPRRWADLAGARVGLWGLGVEGTASRRRLASMGITPICVEDTPTESSVLATAAGGLDALLACDVVIKSPGVSRYRPEVATLEAGGVAVVGGMGLWLEGADRDRVIGITGTKGKSTTASIAAHLLARLGRTVFVGGNIGAVPFDPDAPTDVDAWVIELSSFQVMDLWSAPAVVAVTSLHSDHLDWHGSDERYVADKLSLCTKPGARDVIVNGADRRLRGHAALLGPHPLWVQPDGDVAETWTAELGLRGAHNHVNALIAARCLRAFGPSASPDELRTAAAGFAPLPSRLSTVATVGEVEFVDDSLSTNVLATIAAVDVFAGRRVALLVGGHDRQIDYAPLADALRSRAEPLLLVALPDNGPRIAAAVGGASVVATDLEDGVAQAWDWAKPDGVVLLSPAAPSFGRFVNYRDRSEAFAAAVRRCIG